jgi:hypothetical protein
MQHDDGLRAGFAGTVVVIALALAIPLVPGLPEIPTTDSILAFVAALWGVQAGVVGATLVALFFAFGSVQSARPTKAALDELLKEIKLGPILGLFFGVLVAYGLSFLLLQPAPWAWPLDSPSLESLPLLDFAFFVASMVALLWLVWKAAHYLHPAAAHDLTLKQAKRLALAVSRHERSERAERSRESPTFERVGRVLRARPSKVRREPRERSALIDLFNEVYERGVKALETDDLPSLEDALSVFRIALTASILESRSTGAAEAAHRAAWGEFGSSWALLESRLCVDRASYDSYRLMDIAATRPESRCSRYLLWFPFSLWRLGLENDDHEVVATALDAAAGIYWQIARPSSQALVSYWLEIWREHLFGPEHFVTSTARAGIRPEQVALDDVLHCILSSLEVQRALFLVAALAIHRDDIHTCGNLVASHVTMANVFWPINDPDWRFPEGAKQALESYDNALRESMVVLIGLAAVKFENGGTMEGLLKFMLEAAKSDFQSLADLESTCAANLHGGPRWFARHMDIAEPPFYASAISHDYAYPEDLQAWAHILLLPQFVEGPVDIESLNLGEGDSRAAFGRVLGRIQKNRERWDSFLGGALSSIVGPHVDEGQGPESPE